MQEGSNGGMSTSFLLQTLTGRYRAHDRREVQFSTPDGALRADVYEPPHPPRATILTINGLAPLGNRDPRFERVNRAMAGTGFRVVSPFLEDLCQYRIGVQNIRQVRGFIEAVLESEYAIKGRVSIFAPSFAGSLSMIAASDPAVSNRIDAICALGSYASAPAVIEKLFVEHDVDEYGRLILLLNYLHLSIGRNQEVEQALKLAIEDSYFHYRAPLLDGFLDMMQPENRLLFESVRKYTSARNFHWKIIERNAARKGQTVEDLSLASPEVIANLKAAISLIHGKNDAVVPASESVELYELLKKAGKKVRLTVTPLLSHGDQASPILNLHHLPGLVSGFGFFFKHARVI
ncbi:MAG: prolyl oligopeptidase family serine peptidase [Leptospiraceae bacterium]|nr:prolyl oligopeptidase family serine peptidase [Leptospiraceae bacterium]